MMVCGRGFLAAQAADPVTSVLESILDHVLGAHLVPNLGQVDEVVLDTHAQHSLEIGSMLSDQLLKNVPYLCL